MRCSIKEQRLITADYKTISRAYFLIKSSNQDPYYYSVLSRSNQVYQLLRGCSISCVNCLFSPLSLSTFSHDEHWNQNTNQR